MANKRNFDMVKKGEGPTFAISALLLGAVFTGLYLSQASFGA